MNLLLNTIATVAVIVPAHSAVVAFDVQTPPPAFDPSPRTTDVDFDADGGTELIVLQGGTNCIANDLAHRCSRGFKVTLSPDVEIHAAGREITQLGLGDSIGADIIGSDGTWGHLDFFNLSYSYGTSPDSYNFELGARHFALPIRVLTDSGYRYGYLGVSLISIEQSIFTGLNEQVIHPHVDVVFVEDSVNSSVVVTSIPEPTLGFLTLLGVGVLALKSQWRTRRG